MFGLGATEVIVILVIALIFIGPKKLPELAKGLGKGLREFQKAKDDLMTQVNEEVEDAKLDELIEKKKQEEATQSPTGVATDAESKKEETTSKPS
ncbi:MAG: twin-arginine translocase TatA/TatE family subunit [Bacteriovoracaceae bacterium]|nr:twin-arginine translocase TatA/TatE family subunit [Bacteriovoracaceae bacterium]